MIKIRPCGREDLTELCQISRQTFDEAFRHLNDPTDFDAYLSKAFTHERLGAELDNPNCFFFFATQHDAILGYLKLNLAPAQSDNNDPESLEIERIYVQKQAQGKQIGQILIEKSIEMAQQFQKKYLWLGVWEKNEGAIRFYERMGFEKFDEHVFMMGSDAQTDWLMRRTLIF